MHNFYAFAVAIAASMTIVAPVKAQPTTRQQACSSTTGPMKQECLWLYDQGPFKDAQQPNKTKKSPVSGVDPLINQPARQPATSQPNSNTSGNAGKGGSTGGGNRTVPTTTGGRSPNTPTASLPSRVPIYAPPRHDPVPGMIGYGIGAVLGGILADVITSGPQPEPELKHSRRRRTPVQD